MTKNTKIIIGVVSGLILIGGFVVIAAIVGILYLAAQQPLEAKNNDGKTIDKPSVAENKLYKKSDVDGLIEFHEWVAKTKFSSDERKKFEAFLAKDFERDEAKTRQDTDELLKVYKEVKSKDKDTQELTRTLLVGAYIEDFKRKKSDEFSQFLLGVYQKADDEQADVSNYKVEKASFTGGGVPDEMVGKWHRSEGSSQIDYTGKTQYGGGTDFTYEFSADGSMKYLMETKILSILQCKIEKRKSAQGLAAVSGYILNIDLGETAFASSNSCESSENFDKTLPAETVSLKWRFKTEYDVTQLCITENDGEMCYDRRD